MQSEKECNMIQTTEPWIDEKELEYVTDCIRTGWISSIGKYIPKFEEIFASFCNTKYASTCSSGTAALHLALMALGIGKGDEVIVPSLTFVATANAVTYTGAKPIFVDSHPTYWCVDPDKIDEAVSPRTKAIIPVHLYGHPAMMTDIMKIANKYGLFVIEDAAEAHGAEYNGQKVGSFGDIGCFSQYGNKIITCGESGMCVSNNPELDEKIKLLRDHYPTPTKYWYEQLGYNYRLTNIQAAIGCAQLEKIETIIKNKRNNARIYNDILSCTSVILPPEEPWAKSVYWMYSILTEKRDELMIELRKNNIDSRPFFNPMHIMPLYRTIQVLPVSEHLAKTGINLPSSPLLTFDNIIKVCDIIKKVCG